MSQHNESKNEKIVEDIKPSKMDRVKKIAFGIGVTTIPLALTAIPMIVAVKTGRMNFETARLNLETARINHPS